MPEQYIEVIWNKCGTHLIQLMPQAVKMQRHFELDSDGLESIVTIYSEFEVIVYTDYDEISDINWQLVSESVRQYLIAVYDRLELPENDDLSD